MPERSGIHDRVAQSARAEESQILKVAGSSPAAVTRAKALIQLPGVGNPEWIHSIKLTAGKDRQHARWRKGRRDHPAIDREDPPGTDALSCEVQILARANIGGAMKKHAPKDKGRAAATDDIRTCKSSPWIICQYRRRASLRKPRDRFRTPRLVWSINK